MTKFMMYDKEMIHCDTCTLFNSAKEKSVYIRSLIFNLRKTLPDIISYEKVPSTRVTYQIYTCWFLKNTFLPEFTTKKKKHKWLTDVVLGAKISNTYVGTLDSDSDSKNWSPIWNIFSGV